jgi:hypothetical protein
MRRDKKFWILDFGFSIWEVLKGEIEGWEMKNQRMLNFFNIVLSPDCLLPRIENRKSQIENPKFFL